MCICGDVRVCDHCDDLKKKIVQININLLACDRYIKIYNFNFIIFYILIERILYIDYFCLPMMDCDIAQCQRMKCSSYVIKYRITTDC